MKGRQRRTFTESGEAGGEQIAATATPERSNSEIMESISTARAERAPTTLGPLSWGGDSDASPELTPSEVTSVLDAPDASWQDLESVATEARAGLGTQLEAASIPEDQRATLVARMEGLSGTDLVREMRAIEHALQGPNASRAMEALAQIDALDGDNSERVTSEMVEMLIDGVADSRVDPREEDGDGGRGVEGVLGVNSVTDAAHGLMEMSDEDYAYTVSLLRGAGHHEGAVVDGADSGLEQALVLQAIAARRGNLEDGADGLLDGGASGVQEVRQFATAIRGMDRGELSRQSTVRDLHSTNDSTRTPSNLPATPGDTASDNDGLYQRFTESCGPTAVQMVRAAADPAYAMQLHDGDFDDPNAYGLIGSEQGMMLTAAGGVAVPRVDRQSGATDAIGRGMDVEDVLDDELGETTNATYDYEGGLSGSLYQNLEAGEDVILRVGVSDTNSQAGHYVVASDMRGTSSSREYLISDPMTGATRWVAETDLQYSRLNEEFNYTETPEGERRPHTPMTHTFQQE